MTIRRGVSLTARAKVQPENKRDWAALRAAQNRRANPNANPNPNGVEEGCGEGGGGGGRRAVAREPL